jgi:hypothetical protein
MYIVQPASVSANDLFHPQLRVGQSLIGNLDGELRPFSFVGSTRYSEHVKATVESMSGSVATMSIDESGSGKSTNVTVQLDTATLDFSENGKETNNQRSAVGMFYNTTAWGPIPSIVAVGQTWSVDLKEPWEMGPAGTETVRVTALDAAHDTITLQRDGSGEGPSSTEIKHPVSIKFKHNGVDTAIPVTVGKSTWHGEVVLKDGIVVRDSITVKTNLRLSQAGTVSARDETQTISETMQVTRQ